MTTKQMSTAEIKDCAKNILEKFAEFCECNDLKYYLAYGTLIGAVRHKGYIPWDDDIDLEMPRNDYNKLMEILAEQNNLITQNIEIKTPYSDNYQYPFIKVVDNTTFVQETSMRKKYSTSIWIDIFPLDNIPDDEKEQKKFIEKLYKMNKYYFYTIERKYTQKNILGKLRFYFVKLFFTPFYAIIKQKERIDKFAQKYKNENTKCSTELIANNLAERSIIENSELEQTKLSFENRLYTTFANYDSILRKYYGDYMELPPENERVGHSPIAYKLS